MEPTLTEIKETITSLAEVLVTFKEKDIIKQSTFDKLDELVLKVLNKLDVCLDKIDFCSDGGSDSGDENQETTTTTEYDPDVFVGFSVNLYGTQNDDTGNTEGLEFKVEVDGVVYLVDGSPTKTPTNLHYEMHDLLKNNVQGFVADKPYLNGSPTNYGHVLTGPASILKNKKVTVEVIKSENSPSYYGNITVNNVTSPADPQDMMGQFGLTPGIGYFTTSN